MAQAGAAWLRDLARGGRHAARPAVALGLVMTIAACLQAWCLAQLLAAALAGAFAGWGWVLKFAGLAIYRAGLGWLQEQRSFEAGASARRSLRSDLFARVLAAGPAVLRRGPALDLATLAIDRIEGLDGLFSRWLPSATLAWAGPAVVLVAVALADPGAAAILLGAGLLVPVGMAVAGLGAAAASRQQFAAMAQLQSRFLDRMRGIATIVLAGRAADEARRLEDAASELSARTMRVLRVAFLSSVALDGAAALALVLLAWRYADGRTAPAIAIFALVLAVEFFVPLRVFAAAYQDRLQASGAADQFAALPVPEPRPAAPPRTVTAVGVTVVFENVRYAWDSAGPPVLDGLSFRVPPGETLVLAGPSGSGKSTIIELLLGFVRPQSGRITLNGADLATVVPEALARMTSWIGQQPMLFAGSIRDNIRFGRPEATEAELQAAVQAAGVGSFASALPEGLDTAIGDGGYGLSGGQAQRVAVARAFLRNAPLLLLDEPTAHLDPATEADVFAAIRRLAMGRTVILASHSAAAHAFSFRRLDLGAMPVVQGAA